MNRHIRLNDREINVIVTMFRQHFGVSDHLWLFGSRVDLTRRGGDIDLYIETYFDSPADIAQKKIKFLVDLKSELGEQKIDIVIKIMKAHEQLPIYEEARNSGVRLL